MDKIADALHIHKHREEKEQAVAKAEESKAPVFDSDKVTVLFVLGGPGAGAHPPRSPCPPQTEHRRRQRHPVREPRPRLWLLPSLRCALRPPRRAAH